MASEGPPSNNELCLLASRIGRRWKAVGAVLGLKDYDVDQIAMYREDGIVQQAFQMLLRWKQLRGQQARIAEAQTALDDVIVHGASNLPPAPFPTAATSRLTPGSFVGRSHSLSWMNSYFFPDVASRRREFQMLLLHGLGGVGKTELTLEYIRHNRLQYSDGVFLLNAESTASLRTSVCCYLCELGARPALDARTSNAEDWSSFQALLGRMRESLLVFDSADDLFVLGLKTQHFLPHSLANLPIHVIICSRDVCFDGTLRKCEKKEIRLLQLNESLELFWKHCHPSLEPVDLQAAEELVGEKLVNGLPLGLVHAAAHIKACGITVQEYVRKVKEKEESIKMMRKDCPLSDFLRFFHLNDSHVIDHLQEKLGMQKATDLERLTDADVQSLKLSGKILDNFQLALQTVRDKLPNFPVWEMDIEVVKESDSSYELLKCCALLAPSAIPEYLLRTFYHQHGGSDHSFQRDIQRMTDFALLSPTQAGTSTSYQMHRLVQESIHDFRLRDKEETQHIVDNISCCLVNYFPQRDTIVQGIDLTDHNLSDLIPHLNSISTLISDLQMTDGKAEELFELTRTVAFTIKDLPWALKLCHASAMRAVSTGMADRDVLPRLIDEATCCYEMKKYTSCVEIVGKAKEYIGRLMSVDPRLAFSFTVRSNFLTLGMSLQQLIVKPYDFILEVDHIFRLHVATANSMLAIATFCSNQFVEICQGLQQEFKQMTEVYRKAFGDELLQASLVPSSHLGSVSFEHVIDSFHASLTDSGVTVTQNFGILYQETKEVCRRFWSKLLTYFPPFESSLVTVTYLRDLGEFLQVMDEHGRAEVVYKKALELEHEVFPEDHPIISETQEQLGNCYLSLGRDAKAAKCYREALRIATTSSTNDYNIAQLQRKRAKALVNSEPDEAKRLLEDAVSVLTRPDDPIAVCAAKTDLAEFYCSQQKPIDALTALEEADYVCSNVDGGSQMLAKFGPETQQILIKSRCYLLLDDYKSVIELVEPLIDPASGLKMLQSIFPSLGEFMGDLHMCLAQCFCQQQNCLYCVSHCKYAIENYANCQPRKDHKLLAAIALWTRSCVASGEGQYQILDSINVLEDIKRLGDISDVHITALQEVAQFLEKAAEDMCELLQQVQEALFNVLELQDSKRNASLLEEEFPLPWEAQARTVGASSDSSHCDMAQSVEPHHRHSGKAPAAVSPADDRRRAYEGLRRDHPPGLELYTISQIDPETCSGILSSSRNISGGGSTSSSLDIPAIVISRSTAEQASYVSSSHFSTEAVIAKKDTPVSPAIDLDNSAADKMVKAMECRKNGDKLHSVTLEEISHSCNPSRLPADDLIGRDEELNQLFAIFHPSVSRQFQVVVLHGTGGIGKTFLAQKFIEKFGSFYSDGIVWFSAESTLSIHRSNCIAVTQRGFQTFNHFVEDLQSFQAMASQQQSMLVIYDNVDDLQLVEACIRPIVGTIHILVVTRSQSFYGPWIDVPKIQLKPLTVDQAVQLVMESIPLSRDLLSREDNEALKEVIGQDVTGGLPLALVYFSKKFCTKPGITIADYLVMFKEYSEQVRQQISTVDGWLKFYHLSGLKEDLTSKYDVQSVSDIRSLNDSQIQRLGLTFFDQRRLKAGIVQLKSDKPIRLPLWELDIQDMSARNGDSHKLLHYCALLSSAPIPGNLLRECLKEHVIPLSDDQFHNAVEQLTDSGLISQKDRVSVTGSKCYTLSSRIQQFIRQYHLTNLDVQYRLSVLSQVISRHLPPLTDIQKLLLSMDPSLIEILPHIQALAKTIDRANVLDSLCEKILDFLRVLAVTVRDPWLELSLCQQGVKRALSKRLESEEVASRLIDLALCYAERKQWEACQQTLHEAQVIINRIENPLMSLTARVIPLQSMMFTNQLLFYVQFGGEEFSDVFLSGQGFSSRLIDLLTHYSVLSDNGHLEEIFSIIMPPLSEAAASPGNKMITPQLLQRLDQLGVKSTEQIYYSILQGMGPEKLLEMAQDTESNLRVNAGGYRKAWKVLLRYDAPTDINLQTLKYWRSCGEYLCNVGQSNKAFSVYRRILDMLQHCLPRGHPSIGETLKQMGDSCRLMDDLSQAFDYYSQASNILSLGNQDHLQLAMFFTNLAKSCATFKPDLAAEKLMQALQLYEGTGDPILMHAASKDLANFFYEQKQYGRAVETCQGVEKQLIQRFGQLNMQIPGRMMCFAINGVKISSLVIHCLKEMGEYQAAVVNSELLFNEMNQATVQAKTVASGRAILGDVKLCVGDCLLAEELTAEALSTYREALHFYQNSVGKGDLKMIAGLLTVAHFYQTCGSAVISLDQSFLDSVDALRKVANLKELAQCHAEDLGNLVSFFATVGDEGAAQLALEASMAVSECVEHRKTASANDDLLLPMDFPGQQPQMGSSSLTAFSSSHEITSTQTTSSSEYPSSMTYSINLLPMETIRDLLAWSCIPRLLTAVEDMSDYQSADL